jgi:hypothetical protein
MPQIGAPGKFAVKQRLTLQSTFSARGGGYVTGRRVPAEGEGGEGKKYLGQSQEEDTELILHSLEERRRSSNA